jgi:bifunctional UDP-N-acetylglucosamine pyrophosphorylase/glucosamine-1-phosphate N-acetyltransferase
MSCERDVAAVILAAGLGTRMGSDQPKALLPLGGRPIVKHVLDAVVAAGIRRIVVVVGHQRALVQSCVGNGVTYAEQECQQGTAHALMCAREALRDFHGRLITLYCDVPFVPPDLLRCLAAACAAPGVAAAIVTVEIDQPGAYGRILRDGQGKVTAIREAAGAAAAQLAIKEINAGIYCFRAPLIFDVAAEIAPDPVKGELYLTDAIAILAGRGHEIAVIRASDPSVVMGVNTPAELAAAERLVRGITEAGG